MPALMSTTACIMVGMLLQAFFGGAGLLFILLAIPLILFIKKICANDDKAIDILKLEMSCFLNRANSACFGGTYTLAPIKYGRNINVYKRSFEKTAKY
jgi:type IV secretion system protein VirB3